MYSYHSTLHNKSLAVRQSKGYIITTAQHKPINITEIITTKTPLQNRQVLTSCDIIYIATAKCTANYSCKHYLESTRSLKNSVGVAFTLYCHPPTGHQFMDLRPSHIQTAISLVRQISPLNKQIYYAYPLI